MTPDEEKAQRWHFSLWGMLKLITAMAIGVGFWMFMFVSPETDLSLKAFRVGFVDGSIYPSMLLCSFVGLASYWLLSLWKPKP